MTETARPQFATVRPGVMEREEFPGEICQFQLDTENGTEGRMKVLTEEVLDQGGPYHGRAAFGGRGTWSKKERRFGTFEKVG